MTNDSSIKVTASDLPPRYKIYFEFLPANFYDDYDGVSLTYPSLKLHKVNFDNGTIDEEVIPLPENLNPRFPDGSLSQTDTSKTNLVYSSSATALFSVNYKTREINVVRTISKEDEYFGHVFPDQGMYTIQRAFSVQSQRYVSDDSRKKKGGFQYVIPPKVKDQETALAAYNNVMASLQDAYDMLVDLGIPKEDARFVLPNAAATNLTMTANLRALITFYSKRKPGRGSQWEIADFAERVREEVVKAEPWTAPFFEQA